MDAEKVSYLLIDCVRQRPVLFDIRHAEYKNQRIKAISWASVGKLTGLSGAQACKRWRNIRDNFIRFHKRKLTGRQSETGAQADFYYPGLYKKMLWYIKYWNRRPRTRSSFLSSPSEIITCQTDSVCDTQLFVKSSDEEYAPPYKVAHVFAVSPTTGVADMPGPSCDSGLAETSDAVDIPVSRSGVAARADTTSGSRRREVAAAVVIPGSRSGVAVTGGCCSSRHLAVKACVEDGCSADNSAVAPPLTATPVSEHTATPVSGHYVPDTRNQVRESMETAFVTGMNVLGELSKRLLRTDATPEQARRNAFINLLEEQVKQVDIKHLNELQLDILTLVQSYINKD